MRPQGGEYRPDIDGLRAIAVSCVLVFHYFPAWLPGGYVGVDVFFVISGFLITGNIAKRAGEGRFSLAEFYAARARRILPALSLMLASALVAGWLLLLARPYQELGQHVGAAAIFAANLLLWHQINYFDLLVGEKPLLHLWSLGIEEQFYIVWPLLLMAAARRRWPALRLALAIAITSFAYCVWLTPIDASAAFYNPVARAWELMLGALLALTRPKLKARAADAASLAGLGAIAAGCLLLDANSTFPGTAALLPTMGTVALLAAGPGALPNRALLSTRPSISIGLISYPLYLWHWPLLSFATILNYGAMPGPRLRLALLIASAVLAAATYLVIEQRIGVRRSSALILLGITALVGGAGVVVGTDGFPSRRANQDQRRLFVDRYDQIHRTGLVAAYRFECDFYDAGRNARRTAIAPACTAPGARGTVLLWGDTHAQALSAGLRSIMPPGYALAQIATSACSPMLRPDPDDATIAHVCPPSTRFATRTIVKLRPTMVILAQREGHEHVDWTATARWLRANGVRHVVLVGPAPEWFPSLPRVVARDHWTTDRSRIATGLHQGSLLTDRVLAQRYARSVDLTYVSLIAHLCDPRGCLATVPGRGRDALMAVDYGHLSPEASRWVARAVLAPRVLSMIAQGADRPPP